MCLPTGFKGCCLLWVKCRLWGAVVEISVPSSRGCCWASVRMEKVGSAIISPFPEVMQLMLALERGGDGSVWQHCWFEDCAACPASPGCCILDKCMFCWQFRGCCVPERAPRPETRAMVLVCSSVCSPALVWIVSAMLGLVLVFCLPQLVPGCSGCLM